MIREGWWGLWLQNLEIWITVVLLKGFVSHPHNINTYIFRLKHLSCLQLQNYIKFKKKTLSLPLPFFISLPVQKCPLSNVDVYLQDLFHRFLFLTWWSVVWIVFNAIRVVFLKSILWPSPWRRKWQPTPVLAWRIPWTVAHQALLSMGLQRVRHDWVTECMTI